MNQVKIGILDNHQVTLEGLKSIFNKSNFIITSCKTNPHELLGDIENKQIDMVLIDKLIKIHLQRL